MHVQGVMLGVVFHCSNLVVSAEEVEAIKGVS